MKTQPCLKDIASHGGLILLHKTSSTSTAAFATRVLEPESRIGTPTDEDTTLLEGHRVTGASPSTSTASSTSRTASTSTETTFEVASTKSTLDTTASTSSSISMASFSVDASR